MTDEQITSLLATRLLGWGARPDRFLLDNRGWMPRWRFQPMVDVSDAFLLLERSNADMYVIRGGHSGRSSVRVVINGRTGEAIHTSTAAAISYAIARAIGLEMKSTNVGGARSNGG